MTASPVIADRLLYLADMVCNDTACRTELEELDAILAGSEDFRHLYFDYCRMHVLLGIELDAQRAAERAFERIRSDANATAFVDTIALACQPRSDAHVSSPAPVLLSTTLHGTVGYFSSGWPVAYLVATVIFGIGLLVGSLIPASRPQQMAKQSSLASRSAGEPKAELVGRITGMVDCQWSDVSTKEFNGAQVPLRRKYALASGLMEITYDTGARVILQGPVTYEVEARNGGFLLVGKLTGKVEVETAKGFAVRTPTATITDLGTEFGVEVAHDGANQVRVFQGQVALQLSSKAGRSVRPLTLSAGQIARVAADGHQVLRPTGEAGSRLATFVRQFPRVDVKDAARRHSANPNLVSLYTFDNTANNAIAGAPNGWLKATHTVMPTYVAGPVGKAAVDFADNRWDDVGYVFCTSGGFPNSTAGLWTGTWAVWVKWSGAAAGERVLTGSINDGLQEAEICTHGDRVHLNIRAATGIPGPGGKTQVFSMTQTGGTKAVTTDGGPASWHHVAVTYRLTTGPVGTGSGAIYVDGVAQPMKVDVNSIGSTSRFDSWIYEMRIGASGRSDPRNFMSGSMDDVAVWDNPLTATQVKAVCNAGRLLSYNAKDVQSLCEVFAGGPGTQGVAAGKAWQYTTGLKGSPGDVVNNNALILDGAGNGVTIVEARGK